MSRNKRELSKKFNIFDQIVLDNFPDGASQQAQLVDNWWKTRVTPPVRTGYA